MVLLSTKPVAPIDVKFRGHQKYKKRYKYEQWGTIVRTRRLSFREAVPDYLLSGNAKTSDIPYGGVCYTLAMHSVSQFTMRPFSRSVHRIGKLAAHGSR